MARIARTHAQVLTANGFNLSTMVTRIVTTVRQATPAQVVEGATWYGQDSSAILSAMVAASGGALSLTASAAVVAQLSPRTTWKRNVAGALAFATALGTNGGDYGRPCPAAAARAIGCMGANVARAHRAFLSPDPLSTIGGPKTSRFALNLLGDRQAVTVDVWAARVAFGNDVDRPELLISRAGVYGAVEHAYREAAFLLGMDPAAAQATAWVVIRGRAS